jgi:MFS transporter, AAHS family, 4-hydroxybenzoate transporter
MTSSSDAAPARAINISRAIDEAGFGAFQIRAIALCGLVGVLDGMDSQSIAIAAPIIAKTLDLPRASLGPIFSAALLGATLGALSFGTLGDRFGRKRMLIASVLLFGVFTIMTAYATTYPTLLAMRFLAGLGLGGAAPCFISLATEYAPKRRRAMIATLVWAAFPLGGMLGGFFNAGLVSALGWRMMFLVGGVLPLVIAVALLAWLPESIRFLLSRGGDSNELRRIVSHLVPGMPANARILVDEERPGGAPLKRLFTEGRAVRTLLLWVAFFTTFGVLAIVVMWTPVLLSEHDIGPSQAALALGFHGLGALLGIACAGRLIERFGAVAALVPALLLGSVAVGSLGYAATSVATISTALFLIGAFVGIGASGAIALAALMYPTPMRSSGIGLAMGAGRLGQVVAPLLISILARLGWNGVDMFLAFALAPVIGSLAVIAVRGTEQPSPQHDVRFSKP